jgi:hypothetical protein
MSHLRWLFHHTSCEFGAVARHPNVWRERIMMLARVDFIARRNDQFVSLIV